MQERVILSFIAVGAVVVLLAVLALVSWVASCLFPKIGVLVVIARVITWVLSAIGVAWSFAMLASMVLCILYRAWNERPSTDKAKALTDAVEEASEQTDSNRG
jgi:hypothetical protein